CGPAVGRVPAVGVFANMAQQQMNVQRGGKDFRRARLTRKRTERRPPDTLIKQFLAAQAFGVGSGERKRLAVVQRNNVGSCRADVDEETATAGYIATREGRQGQPVGGSHRQGRGLCGGQLYEAAIVSPNL